MNDRSLAQKKLEESMVAEVDSLVLLFETQREN
jgi:hypothetical protein